MNKKTTKRIVIVIGLLLLVAAGALILRYFNNANALVASNPANINELSQVAETEVIADEAVPLAGSDGVQVIPLISVEVPVVEEATNAPAMPTATPVVPTPTPYVPTAAPEAPTPTPTPTPSPTPEVKTSAAIRLLERANTLLNDFYACSTTDEKRELLEASNYSLGNDAMRTKLLADLGGSWEALEEEVVDATQYQQSKTLYVQVYMSGLGSAYVPVIYTTQNSDRSGNQWSTNLVYNDETGSWVEYTQKHAYNDSRVGFYMTTLYNNEDGWEELKDTMETSPVWEEVVVPESPAPVAP